MTLVYGHEVHGRSVDTATRCAHYYSELDIIAIRFYCCDRWYSCFECHLEIEDHAANKWPLGKFDEQCVLCGGCGNVLTVNEYLHCDSSCIFCEGRFNPGCKGHYDLYFETETMASGRQG